MARAQVKVDQDTSSEGSELLLLREAVGAAFILAAATVLAVAVWLAL